MSRWIALFTVFLLILFEGETRSLLHRGNKDKNSLDKIREGSFHNIGEKGMLEGREEGSRTEDTDPITHGKSGHTENSRRPRKTKHHQKSNSNFGFYFHLGDRYPDH